MTDEIAHAGIPPGPPLRTFLDGSRYWVIELPTVRIGLGHYRPGWTWSKHAGAQTGQPSQAHIGYIQTGTMVVEGADGSRVEVGPGEAFEVGPGHDARVVGKETCVALDVTVKRPGER